MECPISKNLLCLNYTALYKTNTKYNAKMEELDMFKKIKEWWIWMTNKRVLDAINEGASYDEVQAIVWEEMQR